jgi:glycosyltransferase involved in cell wall biosynthesis
LSGVVYTSIFNPHDGRKNWEDLISGFVLALRNCPDATLVLKLIAQDRRAAEPVLAHYAQMQIDHACRLLFVTDFLTSDQMRELARATTYYVTSTRAEGNCLPLMDYLAAGRPAISPKHTAISDYFGTNAGFVVDSHPEPCSWPQDRSGRWRTSWHRIVWPSLADAFEKSYNLARNDAAAYCRLSAQARQTMQEWSHPELVVMRLRAVVEEIVSFESDAAGPTRIGNEALPERRAAA